MSTNVLDENVVILKFDNSNFKKNTEDSIKSLDRLKASLKNTGGESLSDLGKAANSIDLSGMSKAIDTVNKRFSLLGVAGMAAINKLTTSAMSSVASVAKAIPNQMIQGGWRRALNIENATFLIEGLGKKFEGTFEILEDGTEKIEGLKGAVLASVNDTRYGLDEAAKVAAQFLASGVEDVDEMTRRLRAVSGLASVTNSEFSDIGRIFTQVAGQGRMMGDDLLQISQRGINAAAKIRDYLNANEDVRKQAIDTAIAQGQQVKKMEEISKHAELTEFDIREMVSAGAISFDVFSSSFEDFFKQAQQANNTYEGSFANVKAAFSRMGAQVEDVKLKNLTKIFNTLLPILKQFEKFIQPFTAKINETSQAVTDFINEGILNPLGEFIGVDPEKLFHGFVEDLEDVADGSKKAGDETENLGDKLRVTAQEWQAALDIWNKGTYGRGQSRADAIRELGMSYENVQGIINDFYANSFDWEKTRQDYLVDSEEENKKNEKSTEDSGKAAEEASKKYGKFANVISGVVNIIKSLYNLLKGVKNLISAGWNAIKGTVYKFAEGLGEVFYVLSVKILGITQAFNDLSETIKSKGLAGIKDDYPATYSALSAVSKAVGLIGSAFMAVFDIAKGLFFFLINGPIPQIISSISKLASTIFKAVSGVINKIIDKIGAVTKVFNGKTGVFLGITGIIQKITDAITSFIDGLVTGERVAGSFFSAIGVFANNLFGLLKPIVDFLIETIGNIITTVIEFFKELSVSEGIKELKETLSDLVDTLFKTEKPLGNVVEGIHSLTNASQTGNLDKVVNFFSNVAKSISDFVKNVRDGQNPLSSFIDAIKGVKGSFSISGIFEYLKSTLGFTVESGFKYGFESLTDIFVEFTEFLSELDIANKAKAAAIHAIDGITFIVDKIKKIDFDSLFKTIKSFNWESISKVAFYFAGMFGMLKTARDMGMVAQSAAGMFKSISGMFGAIASIPETINKAIKIKAFETLALAVAILIGSIVALAAVPMDRLKPAISAVTGILMALTAIMILMNSKYMDPAKVQNVGLAFAGIGAGVFLIATSIALIARINGHDLIKAGIVIGAFMLIMVLISKRATSMAGTGAAFLGLAVAVNLLVTAVMAFALMPFGVLVKGGVAIFALMMELSLAAKVAKEAHPGGLIAMAVALNLLIPSIIILAMLPAHMIIKGGLAVEAMMIGMAYAAKIAGKGSFESIGKMAIVIGVLAAACMILSLIPAERLLPAAAAIAGMMVALGTVAKASEKSTKSILAMVLVIAALAGAVLLLSEMAPDKAIPIALSLAVLLGVLGGVLAIFSKLKINLAAAAEAAGAIDVALGIIVGGIMAIISIIGGIREAVDAVAGEGAMEAFLDRTLPIIYKFGDAIGGFFGHIKSSFQEASGDADEATSSFENLVTKLTDLLGMMSETDKADLKKLGTFADALSEFGSAKLKDAIAGFIDSWGGTQSLSIGAQISSFTEGYQKLCDGVKDIPPDSVKNAQAAADVFAAFAHGAHEMPMQGGLGILVSFKSISQFAKAFPKVAKSIAKTAKVVNEKKIDSTTVEAIQPVIDILNKFIGLELPESGGWDQFVEGNTTIGEFGKFLSDFASSFADFNETLSGDGLDAESLKTMLEEGGQLDQICAIITKMVEVGNTLPPTEGVETWLKGGGTESLSEFGLELYSFAGTFSGFTEQIAAITTDNLDAAITNLEPIGKVIGAMCTMAIGLPPKDGVEQWLAGGGTQSLTDFAQDLENFSLPFDRFVRAMSRLTIDEETIHTKIPLVAEGIGAMAGVAEKLPTDASIWTRIGDLIKADVFGSQLETMIGSLIDVSNAATDVDVVKINTVATAIDIVSESVSKLKSIGYVPKGGNLVTLADNVKKYHNKLHSVNTSLTSASSNVAKSVSTIVAAAKAAAADKSAFTAFAKAGAKAGANYASGISAKKNVTAASKAGKSLASNATTGMGYSGKQKASEAAKGKGRNAGQGFVDGVDDKGSAAYNAGKRLADQFLQGLKDKLHENSPSREARDRGRAGGEGFALGIKDYERLVYHQGEDLAHASLKGMNDALSNIDDEAHPTITPVVDMSNVIESTKQIDSIMSNRSYAMAYTASGTPGIANMGNEDMAINNLADKLDKLIGSGGPTDNSSRSVTNYITVDGSENPELFAQKLLSSIKMKTRTV